ncbi:hypothetical protein ACFQ9X_20785 [Catenulispora yoronensis]
MVAALIDDPPDGPMRAIAITRALRTNGDRLRRQADGARDFLDFHRKLHLALLSYIASLRMSSSLLASPAKDRLPPNRLNELRDIRDSTEEMRVIIGNSLLSSALDRPFSPDLTRMDRWEPWLSHTTTQDLNTALNNLDDLYLRLIFPRFIQRIAEECIRLDHPTPTTDPLPRALHEAERLGLAPTPHSNQSSPPPSRQPDHPNHLNTPRKRRPPPGHTLVIHADPDPTALAGRFPRAGGRKLPVP